MPPNTIPPTADRLDVLRSYSEQIDIRLFTNVPVLDASTVVGTFSEANFPGYSPKRSADWAQSSDPLYVDSVMQEATFRWQSRAAAPGQIVRGWFATVTFPDNTIRLLAAHILEAPVTMETLGSGLSLDVAIKGYLVD